MPSVPTSIEGDTMKYSTPAAGMAALFAVAAIAVSTSAHAQSKPVAGWQPPTGGELDPAKRLPAAPVAQGREAAVDNGATPTQPIARTQGASTAYAPIPHDEAPASDHYEEGRGGFFLGVKGGKGWVYDDVDQSAREVSAGYRWQAGAVALVGIELARGELGDTHEDGLPYADVDYGSIGVNARFNFGRNSPVYGLVRAGYWSAEEGGGGIDVDGGYFGVGLGVDVNRHVNLGLTYTNYVYFDSYYSYDDYEISRADTLMLGAEVRF